LPTGSLGERSWKRSKMVNIERTMGKQVIEELSQRLLSDYGSGFSVQNLWLIRQFYLNYPRLVSPAKIPHALRGESSSHNKLANTGILYAPRRESWKPGQLNPNFSWTHYRILLRVDKTPGPSLLRNRSDQK
jgi:hypothetical protein